MKWLRKLFSRKKETKDTFLKPPNIVAGLVLVKENVRLAHRNWQKTVSLPAIGRFVEESHYATSEDKFPNNRLFPINVNELINHHLQRSLETMKLFGWAPASCTVDKLYDVPWRRQWTPAEHGLCGQGARGNRKPGHLEELFQGNMMYATGKDVPATGTKYLASANGRHVVVSMGWEIGPPEEKFLGGFTPEVHYYLQTDNDSKISFGRLADQSIPYGPYKP